jgi:hypothetical protein
MRLVADIERLLKTKIELEPLEFEENLPDIRKQGHINDGRRMYQQELDDPRQAEFSARVPRAPRNEYRRTPVKVNDPFFDKPYEPPVLASDAVPSWEAAAARPGARSISSNIKSKRKVAALFKSA